MSNPKKKRKVKQPDEKKEREGTTCHETSRAPLKNRKNQKQYPISNPKSTSFLDKKNKVSDMIGITPNPSMSIANVQNQKEYEMKSQTPFMHKVTYSVCRLKVKPKEASHSKLMRFLVNVITG